MWGDVGVGGFVSLDVPPKGNMLDFMNAHQEHLKPLNEVARTTWLLGAEKNNANGERTGTTLRLSRMGACPACPAFCPPRRSPQHETHFLWTKLQIWRAL
jgi:hypothetical protein